MEAKPPARIGPYRVLEPLGEGGMGIVYRASHVDSNHEVALKTVRVPHQRMLSSIRREILALSQITHPCIVKIESQGIQDGLPWYAMELLDGETLHEHHVRLWSRLQALADASTVMGLAVGAGSGASAPTNAGAHPTVDDAGGASGTFVIRGRATSRAPAAAGYLTDTLTLLRRLCEPLAFLHGQGIVHRDLKPANVFIRRDGSPVLMDFGIVSRFGVGAGREVLDVNRGITGTVHYMAPEQILGEAVDARADLYSLGCMLFECLTGQVPFHGRSAMEVIGQHLMADPEPPSRHVDGVSPALDEFVLRLLAKRPRDRLGHAGDVARALAALGAEGTGTVAELHPRGYLYRPGFAGREGVIEELSRYVLDLRNGAGSLVLLAGESGVGKTRLAGEVGRVAASNGVQVITGECIPMASGERPSGMDLRGAPLHPFTTLLQTIADRCHEGGPEETARLLGPRVRVLAAYEPALATVPGYGLQPEPAPLPAEAAHRRLLECLGDTLAAFAEREPLLVILDDLQWADELSLAFLGSLTEEWLQRSGTMLLATYRAEETNENVRALLARPAVKRVDVGRLDEPTVGAIVGDMLALATPPANFVRFLARRSEGNPFFVAECLRVALAEGLLYRTVDGQWRLATTEEGADREALYEALPLPRSIQDLVARRLEGLSEATRRCLSVATVIGRELEADLLAAVLGGQEQDFLEAVKDLLARQILEEPAPGALRFSHDKLREISYAQIDDDPRRALHRQVAEAIEARYGDTAGFSARYRELANHYTEARVWPKVLDYLDKAGEQALRAYSNREAAGFFRDAIALNEREALGADRLRQGRWERALTEAHLNLGDMGAGRRHAERALAHVGYPMPGTTLGWMVGLAALIAWRVARSVVPGQRIEAAPDRRARMREAAYVYNRMLEQFLYANDALRGAYCGMVNLDLAEALPPSPELARGYAMMCIAVSLTLRGVADAWSKRAIEIAEKVDDPSALAWSLGRVSCYAVHVARWPSAYAWLARSIDTARALGDKRIIEECVGIQGNAYHLHGRFAESVAAWSDVEASTRSRGDTQTTYWAHIGQAQNLVRLGDTAGALAKLQASLSLVEQHAASTEKLWARGVLALAHLRAGDRDAARAAADEALARMEQSRPVVWYVYAAVRAVPEVYLDLWEAGAEGGAGTSAALRRAAGRACDIARVYGWMFPFAAPLATLLRGRLAWLEGRKARARRLWQAALADAERKDMAYEQGLAHDLLGRFGAEDLRDHLAKALALFDAVGAAPDAARARAALAALEG